VRDADSNVPTVPDELVEFVPEEKKAFHATSCP
jgi:hypothetical protein